jgi:hypothetical protein
LRRHRRRVGEESVRVAYARQLRQQHEGRPLWEWGAYARRVADLESGRAVAVKFWEVRQHCPHLRLDSAAWVEIRGDDVVPVEPVRSSDGMRIFSFLPVGNVVTRPNVFP